VTPERIAEAISNLSVRQLTFLNRLLEDEPGWGGAGVREPRRPLRPLDAQGVALESEKGKAVA